MQTLEAEKQKLLFKVAEFRESDSAFKICSLGRYSLQWALGEPPPERVAFFALPLCERVGKKVGRPFYRLKLKEIAAKSN